VLYRQGGKTLSGSQNQDGGGERDRSTAGKEEKRSIKLREKTLDPTPTHCQAHENGESWGGEKGKAIEE